MIFRDSLVWPSYEHDLNTHRVVLQASGYEVK